MADFGNTFYLIIFIINLLGLIYYAYLTYLNPKQLINDYEIYYLTFLFFH